MLTLVILAASCGTDNRTTVKYELDQQGCLVSASNYNDAAISATDEGFRTANFNWWCADYANIEEGISVREKRVTLTFTGTTCLELSATVVGAGYCTGGANPIL